MTAKNAILLIIKQSPGIDYNALVSRIASNYGSVNSARAALSRALKDMLAVGLIAKQDRKFVATEKGQVQIHSEMKNKLLIKLNQTIQTKNSVNEIDAIVEQLAILIERGKQDTDLLKAAKGSARFLISDLRAINDQLNKRTNQLHYLQEVFNKQIEALSQLDFSDSFSVAFTAEKTKQLEHLVSELDANDFLVESNNSETIEQIANALGEKTKSQTLLLPKHKTGEVLAQFQKTLPKPTTHISIACAGLTIHVKPNEFIIQGPHSKIHEIKNKFQ